MSISIYYTARRRRPLSPAERDEIDTFIARHSVSEQLKAYLHTGQGHNWSSFVVYAPTDLADAGVILDGATALPDNTEDASWVGVQHWCKLLTDIRLAVPDASWEVHVEDHEIVWDDQSRQYDPSV